DGAGRPARRHLAADHRDLADRDGFTGLTRPARRTPVGRWPCETTTGLGPALSPRRRRPLRTAGRPVQALPRPGSRTRRLPPGRPRALRADPGPRACSQPEAAATSSHSWAARSGPPAARKPYATSLARADRSLSSSIPIATSRRDCGSSRLGERRRAAPDAATL